MSPPPSSAAQPWAGVATKLNKHRTLMISTVGYAICQASLFVIPKGMFIAAVPGMLGCGFIAAGFTLLIRAMIADVGDEVRLEQGKERMSLLYSLVTTTTKVGSAITVPVSYSILAYVGYKTSATAVNTPGAIHGLVMCYVFAPVFFVLVGGAVMFGYKLDAKRHADIRAKARPARRHGRRRPRHRPDGPHRRPGSRRHARAGLIEPNIFPLIPQRAGMSGEWVNLSG